MKITTLLIISLVPLALVFSQSNISQRLGINDDGNLADASAQLDVSASDKGVLIPRMTQTQRNAIADPATGLLIYQTDNTPGFYYNAGTQASPDWQLVGSNAGVFSQWNNNGQNIFFNDGNVGIGTNNPTALLHTSGTGTGEGNVMFTGQFKASSPGGFPIQGAGTRMMWYPDKAAFRAGRVTGTQWSADSIGLQSVAFGLNTKASHFYSTAWGVSTHASGNNSTCWGQSTNASGITSTAWGRNTRSPGTFSSAWGDNTVSLSFCETVFGRFNTEYIASGGTGFWNSVDRLLVIGNGSSDSTRNDALVLLKNGNMGIGTSNPRGRFNISLDSGVTDESVINDYPLLISYPTDANGEETGIAFRISSGQNISTHTPGAAITHLRTGNNSRGDLLFKTRSSTANDPVIERMRINGIGRVGIGEPNPSDRLTLKSDEGENALRVLVGTTTRLRVYSTGGVGIGSNMLNDPPPAGALAVSSAGLAIGATDPSGFLLRLSADAAAKPTSNTWTVHSDARLKKNIETIEYPLERLLALRGVTYQWIDPASQGNMDGVYTGFIAQEVEKVFPEWINEDKTGYKTLTVIGFEGLVVEALRKLKEEKDAEITSLRAEKDDEIRSLHSRLNDLEAKLDLLLEQQTLVSADEP